VSSVLSPAPSQAAVPRPEKPRRKKTFLLLATVCAVLAGFGWYAFRIYRGISGTAKADVPTVKVARADVSLSVFAKGEIRGGNSEILTAPMTGGGELHITSLPRNGEQVKAGDVVVQFDTTDQEYALSQAQSDLAEAEQHVRQASAQMQADQEEDRYALLKAETDVKTAELDVHKNSLLPAITARQNDLALQVAQHRLAQLHENLANKRATGEAGIAMQQAGRSKAQSQALTAKQNIQSMTLRAKRSGYVSLKPNMSGNFFFTGMDLPAYQVGDSARPGIAIAEIPDLSNWEVSANIGEPDRGHLEVGDKAEVAVIAVPHRIFNGHIKDIGGTTGLPWDRHFECKLALDETAKELRPGMSARVEVTTETLRDVLWLPAQALFEGDGKMFVYLRSGAGFVRKDVVLVRRNETRVVVTGLKEGREVALTNPTEVVSKKPATSASPLEALPK
jgi:HlyD family secretion protein